MNQTELVQQIRAFLTDKDDVTAPGLELLSKAMAALERDAPAPMAATLPDWARTAETFMYDTLAELGQLPEREDEPAPNLQLALQADPSLPDTALNAISALSAFPPDGTRFINAVRAMLEAGDNEALEQVYGRLEAKAQYLANLEAGIAERDGKLASAEAILSKCLEAAVMDWQDIDDLPVAISRYATTARMHEAEVQVMGERRRGVIDERGNDVVDPAVHLVHERWIDDAVDLAHAVAGNLSAENRVMAKAAKYIIKTAPREA